MVPSLKDLPFCIKKCVVLVERLDEKSLKKCLQKHGLKLATQSSKERPTVDNGNNCQTRSTTKKPTKRERKKRNSNDFIRNRNRKRRKVKPLCYTDDESESSELPTKGSQLLSERKDSSVSSNKSEKLPMNSESQTDNCDEISAGTVVSSVSETPKDLVNDGEKRELEKEVQSQPEDVCCGRTKNREFSNALDSDVEIIRVCEKLYGEEQLATLLNNKEGPLAVKRELVERLELEDDGYDSREDSEDERKTVIFEEEFQKDTDSEDIIELEEKETSKKFSNKEITNRKRQRLVKFKRKSMTGRNLAKVERKPKNKSAEGSGSGQETPEKSSECVSEECLKEVCGLVKRLHELSRIISLLQRELPNNEEMTVHFNGVINAQQENFHGEIRKAQKAIIKCYEEMLRFYSDTSQVALEIGKRTSLSVEDVVNVISLCILVEGRYEAEKSRNVGKQRTFPSATPPDGLQKIVSDNFMKIIKKKMSHKEGLSASPKHPKVSNSFALPSQPCNQQKYQTVGHTGFPPSAQYTQTKQKPNNACSILLFEPNIQSKQMVENLTYPHVQSNVLSNPERVSGSASFPPSRSSIPSKRPKMTKSPGSSLSRPNAQQTADNSNRFPTSLQSDTQQKRKEVNPTGCTLPLSVIHLSQPTRNNSCGFPPSEKQPINRILLSQYNTQPIVDLPPSKSDIQKMVSQPPSQPSKKNTPSGSSKQKKKTNQADNLSGAPKRQIVKHPTGCHNSRPSNPSGDLNQHPTLLNRPCDRSFKSQGKQKAVYSSARQEEPLKSLLIMERQMVSDRNPQKCVLTPGIEQRQFYHTNSRFLDEAASKGPVVNQPVTAGYMVYRGVPTQYVRPPQGSTRRPDHTVGAYPQWNLPPSANVPTPASVTITGLNHPAQKSLQNNRNPTGRGAGCLRRSEFPSATSSTYGPIMYTKQMIPPSAAKCPLNAGNFMVSVRMLDNSKLLKTHANFSNRNCSAAIEVENSESGVAQEVLDPTIPQKLTMKNSRLQAGPVLELDIDGVKIREKSISPSTEERKACNESENSDRGKPQSRVYVCAKEDCRNPGVRICKGCHSIIYCSATCQFKHWVQKHKAECFQLRALRD